jgi:uncharacterized protein YecA (UPF0149 family)
LLLLLHQLVSILLMLQLLVLQILLLMMLRRKKDERVGNEGEVGAVSEPGHTCARARPCSLPPLALSHLLLLLLPAHLLHQHLLLHLPRGRVLRNDPCPCGSGKKYKKCCMRKETEQ